MAYRRPEPLGKRHRFDDFECGEPALDEWLKRHPRSAHASDSARVFVATLGDGETVVGYCALAAAQVAPGTSARVLKGQPRERPVPAILFARLAVDRDHQRKAGPLASPRRPSVVHEATDAIGARVLFVHANHDAAETWYTQYSFEESPTDPLHLMMLMKDVRAFLERHGIT